MDSYTKIRKLRKKLRQIEHLEGIERDLTDEEVSKCIKKEEIREELLELLLAYNSQKTDDTGTELDTSVATSIHSVNLSTSTQDPVIDNENTGASSTHSVNFSSSTQKQYTDNNGTVSDSKAQVPSTNVAGKNVNASWEGKDEADGAGDGRESNKTQNTKPLPVQRSSSPVGKKPAADGGNVKEKNPSSPTKKGKKGNTDSKSEWPRKMFSVTLLESHNDLITAVCCCDGILVSASRDTTIKIWDLETLRELRSLGSHTGSVTDVVVIPVKQAGNIGVSVDISEDDHLVFSGSTDCSLNVWSAQSGELLKSIYTYNPITKVAYHPDLCRVVTASDGGKLELWNIETRTNVCSETAHSDSVTGLCVSEGRIYTSCGVDGEIKVFEIRDDKLHCIYASENIHNISGHHVTLRHVRALAVNGDILVYGDDGVNLKILAWKKGLVKKVANHKEDFGMTDAICCHGNIMVTSAYDLDNGQGYLNVFDMSSEPVYLATLDNEDTRRILDVCCHRNLNGDLTIVTAGLDLQVWKQVASVRNDEEVVQAKFVQQLSQFAQDSDIESEVEFTDTESETESRGGSRRGSAQSQTRGWMSWCSIT